MSVTYRRSVQARFAGRLDDDQIAAVIGVSGLVDVGTDAD
jgi:hypothetical protein